MLRIACVFSLLLFVFGLLSYTEGLSLGRVLSTQCRPNFQTRWGTTSLPKFQQQTNNLSRFRIKCPSYSSLLRIHSIEDSDVVNIDTPSAAAATTTTPSKLLELFTGVGATGGGQSHNGREELHNMGAKRKFSDPQMWTHLFFVAAAIPSYINHVYDLFALLAVVTPLSLAYHYIYEKPGLLAQIEGICAKLLFVYGAAQMFHAPSKSLLLTETGFLLGTIAIFIFTNIKPRLYDPWHCLLHIVPSLWCIVVGLNHKPLFF